MVTLGLDCSTTCCGWAISENSQILAAGFIDLKKQEKPKDKAFHIISILESNPLFQKIDNINLEAALSGFAGGFTSQQVIIMLSRFNAILEYILSERWNKPVNLCNVNTMRKKVFGKARIKGMKPKEYVQMKIKTLVEVSKFDQKNRNGDWDVRNSDMYDAMVAALF